MKKKKQERVLPNKFYWFLYVLLSKIYCKFRYKLTYNNTEFKNRDKSKGCIVLYNHGCADDHMLQVSALGLDRGNFVVTNRFSYVPVTNWCFEHVSAITRDQFRNDTSSILKMKRVLNKNGYFILSPSGQVCPSGKQTYISPVIVKLLKMFKVDIYVTEIHGNYLTKPKWQTSKRKYPVHIDIKKVLTASELESLSDDDLYMRICKSIDFRDYDYQKIRPRKIKGKDIAGDLSNVLYRCPECGCVHTFIKDKDTFTCSKCGYSYRYNEYGNLELIKGKKLYYEHEDSWYLYQQQVACEEVLKDGFSIEFKCDFYSHFSKPKTVQKEGEGIMHIDLNHVYYEGSFLDNPNYHHDFDIDHIIQVPYTSGSHFNIPDADGILEFYPEDPKKVSYYVQLIHGVACARNPELKDEITHDYDKQD